METLNVAAGIIEHKGKYLILKRAPHKENPGLWEFPGGKVNEGESLQSCLTRELQEELGVNATVSRLLASAETAQNGRIIRLFGLETVLDSEPAQLRDHTEFKWVAPEELAQFDMTPAELGLIQHLTAPVSRQNEISAVGLWSCAKIYGIMYGIFGIFMGLFVVFTGSALPTPMTFGQRLFLAATLPFFNLFVGAAAGCVLAVFYNVLASLVGGIKVRLTS